MIDDLLSSFTKFEDRVKNNDINNKFDKPFVICFSPKKDDKAMWSEYNSNVDYCIGIDEKALKAYAETSVF